MRLYEFFAALGAAVASDAAIGAWAQTHFGRPLSVFLDVVSGQLPTAEQMPYAVVHTPAVERHEERRERRYGLAVDLALDKQALKTRPEPNAAEPSGLELALELVELVVGAVRRSLPERVAMGFALSADTLGALPEVHAYIDFEFEDLVVLGEDPLA